MLGVSDRIVVMRQGRISGELSREDATQQTVPSFAAGNSTALPDTAAAQQAA